MPTPFRVTTRNVFRMVCAAATLLALGCARTAPRPAQRTPTEQRFADPKAAVAALVAACRTYDERALLAIFGQDSAPLISTGNPDADRERCRRLVAAADQQTRLDPAGTDALELVIGADDWPFPIPLVRDAQGWRFDTEQGAMEVVRRRVGADELEAIRVSRAYVRAQDEYSRTHAQPGQALYAQKLVSSPGARDGLHWPATGPNDQSPFGREVAAAGDYSQGKRPPSAWSGYHFRVLTAQGKGAPGGVHSYIVDGTMVGGFGLVAYPADYGRSGIMTFIVNRDDRVYEKDLGPKTAAIAGAMTSYDPDATWKLVAD
jgi:Protein of unknown function (DUF2950)